jgi:hypothetical protein
MIFPLISSISGEILGLHQQQKESTKIRLKFKVNLGSHEVDTLL